MLIVSIDHHISIEISNIDIRFIAVSIWYDVSIVNSKSDAELNWMLGLMVHRQLGHCAQ